MRIDRSIAGVGFLSLAISLAQPAFAQDAAASVEEASPSELLPEIIVTARRVEERLQDVPVSVTAVSARDLEQRSALQIQDIATQVPNLAVRSVGGNSSAITFQIRGQIQNDIIGTVDQSVGVYVDEIFWSRAVGAGADLLDIDSVQVLRGPQGTLFGRNTPGGAVVISTAQPDLGGFSGQVSALYGNRDDVSLNGVLNLPLGEKVAFRLAGQYNKSDGFVANLFDGEHYGSRNRWTGRARLLLAPTDRFSVVLSAERFRLKEAQTPFRLIGVDPTIQANPLAPANILASLGRNYSGTGPFGTATPAAIGAALGAPRGSLNTAILGYQRADLNQAPNSFAKTETYSGVAKLDTDWGTVKAIIGYRKVNNSNIFDLDGTPYDILATSTFQSFAQWSGELNINAAMFDDRLKLTTGVYVFDEKGTDRSESQAFRLVSVNSPTIFDGSVRSKSLGMYMQGNLSLTDQLTLTAGVRLTIDDKSLISRNRTLNRASGIASCNIPAALRLDASVCSARFKDSFSSVPYTLGLDYRLSDDAMVYIKTSRGFRSGGQNLRGGLAGPSSFLPFRAESVTDYEAGVKMELFDRRVRFNLSSFYSDYSDIQRSIILTNAGGASSTIVQNAAKARIYGGEAELTVVLIPAFRVEASAGMTNARYRQFIDPITLADRSAESFDYVPEFTLGLAGVYSQTLGNADLMLRVDYNYNDGYSTAQGRAANQLSQPAFSLVNARASVSFMDNALEFAVFARNLFDKQYISDGLFFAPPVGLRVVTDGMARQIGAQATYRF